MEKLKVSANSQPKSVAGALAVTLRKNSQAEVYAVGAGAVNQAVKAIAITRGFLAPNGIDLVAIPAFSEIELNGEKKTVIKFVVQSRKYPKIWSEVKEIKWLKKLTGVTLQST